MRRAATAKMRLSLAFFDGSYDVADFLIDSHANVNQEDAQRFTPLFWAVDRRNMETAPNFPWMVTRDPLPLIKKLLDAGADPNAVINSTPRARMREGSPRIVFATAIMRAAFSGDIELVKLLLAHGADPHIISKDRETTLMAACGTGFINGYHRLQAARRAAGSGETAGRSGRGRECGRQLRHHAADGRGQSGRSRMSLSIWSRRARI